MQHTDKAIAEFEAWWPRQPFHEQFESMKTQMRNVWVASREEMVVILPPKHGAFGHGRSWNNAVDSCRAAIEAAGVKVKE